ncbi:MAG: M15 family metallopeptidase [bacterium]
MQSISLRIRIIYGGIALATLALIVYGISSYHRTVRALQASITKANADLIENKTATETKIKSLSDSLAALETTNSFLTDALLSEQQKNALVTEQIGAVTSTVGNLEKLSKTDPELLKQYSKVYFLNEHYVPVSLSYIDPRFAVTQAKNLQIHTNVLPYLTNLLSAAQNSGLTLEVDSAYRSFGTQAQLKAKYRVTYGAGTANSFSAEQGYSEHQLGTAVDFTTQKIDGALSGFEKTPEYAWLQSNAYQYGFVISYPENNPSYQFEPWHWRFVGVKLATEIHNRGTYFYAMDQRDIDTYLANIFD